MHAAPCGMFHVNLQEDDVYIRCSNFSQRLPHLLSQWVSKLKAFTFGCAKSQNLAVLREIAKYNTRKIVRIPKSQNFVLANNSNIKVPHATPSRVATPCFHILVKKSKTSLESCFFKPRKLLLASMKPP